jgi:dihydrofolate reductase
MTAPLTIVVAVSENGFIGKAGDLPWRLSADLRRFKRLTMGHHLLMGRKTFESIGRLLPGRKTAILTRSSHYSFSGAVVGTSLDVLVQAIDDSEIFVVGGGEVYRLALPLASRMHFTRVHTSLDGDVSFPEVDWSQWRQVATEFQPADERNEFDSTYSLFERI